MPDFKEPSSWTPLRVQQHIDPILLDDQRLNISLEMQPRSMTNKNSAKNPKQWADAELKLADEWANKLFAAWIDIWDTQGLPRCHALYRAIYEWELQQLFGARRSSFTGMCQQLGQVNRDPHRYSAVLGWFAREMDKLASKWNRRMSVESRKSMYAARRERMIVPQAQGRLTPASGAVPTVPVRQGASIPSPFTWRELETRFKDLQSKANEQGVSTNFIRTEWESGKVSEEWFPGGNAVWRAEFDAVASIAARSSGYSQNHGATEYWLNRVREWMREKRLDRDKNMVSSAFGSVVDMGVTGTTQGFSTYRIAELSALFCVELIARETIESDVRQLPAAPQAPTALRPAPNARPLSKRKLKIMQAVFAAMQDRAEGPKYCKVVDRYKPPVSSAWIDDGWPGSYAKAYVQPKWARKIQNQKCKLRKLYDTMSSKQHEEIIQGTGSTRHTR